MGFSFRLHREDRRCAMCEQIRNTRHVIDRLVSQALLRLFALDHHLKEHSAMLSDSLKWGCFDRQNQLPQTIAVCRCNNLYCNFRQQDRQCSVKLSFLFSSIPVPTLPAYSQRSQANSATQPSYNNSCAPENMFLR